MRWLRVESSPGSNRIVSPEAGRSESRSAASATNRCPKQRFACTDGMKPVVFKVERIEEEAA